MSQIQLTSYWARLEDSVNVLGWEQSALASNIKTLTLASTRIVCRLKGRELAQLGAWDNLDISTDGVLFVKDETVNRSMCYVSKS